jgi:amidase
MSRTPLTDAGDGITAMDAVDLSRAIRGKQVSCREVMEAFLDRIDRLNPEVNAIVSLQDREGLLLQADERDRKLARGEYLAGCTDSPRLRRIWP